MAPIDPSSGTIIDDFTPVPMARCRHNGWTAQRQRLFIAALMQTGIVADAAKAVGMSRNSAYALRSRPDAESFVAAWDMALEIGLETALDTAVQRAMHAETVPVFYRGRQVGTRTRHDNRLLMRVLDVLAYRDRAVAERRRSGAADQAGPGDDDSGDDNGSSTFAP